MTTHRITRCTKCGIKYSYQASGYGCQDENNNHEHCPECQRVINVALKGISVKLEQRYRDTKDIPKFAEITIDQVLSWEKETEKENEGKLVARRIFVGLVDMKTGEWENCRLIYGRDKFKGYSFKVSTWDSDPNDYSIQIAAEYDLEKNQFTGALW